jgi:hypothetical protein
MVDNQQLSNLDPDGQLSHYWTRAGLSLTDLRALIAGAALSAADAQAALAAFESGALSGISPLGQLLLTAVNQQAALDALGITSSGGGGGGPVSVDNLTGTTTAMKNFLKAATMAAALTLAGGIPTSLRGVVSGVANLDAQGDVVNSSGVKVLASGALQSQIDALNTQATTTAGQIAVINVTLSTAPTQADLLSTPSLIRYGAGPWPQRPATPRPIEWMDGPAPPPLTGSTSGGGGMASIDFWVG